MIENIPTPLVSFAGSSVAGFFMGMFLRRVLKFLVIIIGSFLGAVFSVIQWMQARQYIQGQVDWNRVGNDTTVRITFCSSFRKRKWWYNLREERVRDIETAVASSLARAGWNRE